MTEVNQITNLTFDEAIVSINEKYISLLNEMIEKFKYHDELIGPLQHDLKLTHEKLVENKYQVIDTITNNFLFCLEQICDHNSDYFIYQKEKIQKKNGKSYKNKLPKIGNRTLLKKILKDTDNNATHKLFKNIIELFTLLTYNEDNIIYFNQEYIEYVKENFTENKNFSKMLMVFDNVDNIINSQIESVDDQDNLNQENNDSDEEEEIKNKSSKKNKNKTKKDAKLGPDFLKGMENTKIAQLAKNISEKINIDDFPALTDPAKLLSSFTNPEANQEGEAGGIQNLLKFVIGEVEDAFKNNNMNEKDLVNEAQNIMGQFTNMSGFDPMSLLKGENGNFNINQFADIFSKMGKK